MRDSTPDLNGLLLRGSSVSEDKALQLLNNYNYNYDLATFHILNAEQMMIPVLKQKYLELFEQEPLVLQRVVAD
jgi:hypothetical protein